MNKTMLKKIGDLSIPLILGIITALIWANINFASYNKIIYGKIWEGVDFHFLVNDVFLVFFFGLATVEIVKGFSPKGNLYPIRNTLSNLIGAAGGVLIPIALFFTFNAIWGDPSYTSGWAIPTATDVAVSLLFAQFIFGKHHPAFSFLLLLAIADDIIGLGIIAIFYPDPNNPVAPMWLFLLLAAVLACMGLKKLGVKNYWLYIIGAGTISWYALHHTGLHTSLALVLIVPFLPSIASKKSHSTIDKFEHDFKPFVDYGLFFFGLSNAGVEFSSVSALTFILFFALFLGKTVGIFSFTKLSVIIFKLPINKRIRDVDLLVISMAASIGLTVSLFISEIAYTTENIKDAAKMGALFSLFNGFIALIVGKEILHHTHPIWDFMCSWTKSKKK